MMYTNLFRQYVTLSTVICIDAIVINEVQTRRATFTNVATSIASLTIAGSQEASAETLNGVQPSLPADERIVVPGTAMKPPLRNLIINEEGGNNLDAWNPPKSMTQLGNSRIGANELSPLQPSLKPFAADNELFYGMSYLKLQNILASM